MLGKPEWFGRRKYSGWGLGIKKWQGYVYVACFAIPLIVFHAIPLWSDTTRLIVTGIWALILTLDVLDIMRQLNNDEREKIHEAFAERNAAYAMLTVLILGIIYETIRSALQEEIFVNPIIIGAVIAGTIAKAISNIYYDKKN